MAEILLSLVATLPSNAVTLGFSVNNVWINPHMANPTITTQTKFFSFSTSQLQIEKGAAKLPR
jgi:hypothetical protein